MIHRRNSRLSWKAFTDSCVRDSRARRCANVFVLEKEGQADDDGTRDNGAVSENGA